MSQGGFMGHFTTEPNTAGLQAGDFYFNVTTGAWRILVGSAFVNVPTSGIVVDVVASLPDVGTTGKVVLLTTDNKLYFDNGTDYKAITSAA